MEWKQLTLLYFVPTGLALAAGFGSMSLTGAKCKMKMKDADNYNYFFKNWHLSYEIKRNLHFPATKPRTKFL